MQLLSSAILGATSLVVGVYAGLLISRRAKLKQPCSSPRQSSSPRFHPAAGPSDDHRDKVRQDSAHAACCARTALLVATLAQSLPPAQVSVSYIACAAHSAHAACQVVIVTGGANGIGRGVCLAFATAGAHVWRAAANPRIYVAVERLYMGDQAGLPTLAGAPISTRMQPANSETKSPAAGVSARRPSPTPRLRCVAASSSCRVRAAGLELAPRGVH